MTADIGIRWTDAVLARLAAESIPARLEHTGGGVMVVEVPLPNGMGIVSDDGEYGVGFYPGTDWQDGEMESSMIWTDSLDAVVAELHRNGASA